MPVQTELAVYVLEGPKDLVELTTWAQQYLIAHKQQLGVKRKTTIQFRLNVPNKENQHILNKIPGKDARGCYSATDAKVMATDNWNV